MGALSKHWGPHTPPFGKPGSSRKVLALSLRVPGFRQGAHLKLGLG